jgi:hypothetical protein
MLVGYARVSTQDQKPKLQIDALSEARRRPPAQRARPGDEAPPRQERQCPRGPQVDQRLRAARHPQPGACQLHATRRTASTS